MRRYYMKLMTFAAMTSGSAVLRFLGCSPVPAVINAVTSVNPCGPIFQCDPAEYAFIKSGIEGPGVRPEYDIFCTYPPFCDAAADPIFGGLAGNP
jgi:hypothetical protein